MIKVGVKGDIFKSAAEVVWAELIAEHKGWVWLRYLGSSEDNPEFASMKITEIQQVRILPSYSVFVTHPKSEI